MCLTVLYIYDVDDGLEVNNFSKFTFCVVVSNYRTIS